MESLLIRHQLPEWTPPPQISGVSIKAMNRRKRRGINPCPPVLWRTRPPLADYKIKDRGDRLMN